MTNPPNDFSWVGLETTGASVLAYFCEDEKDELHRRQWDINARLKVQFPNHQLQHFHMQSRVGKENLLMTFVGDIGTATPFYHQIVADIKATSAQVVILDNLAQLFGGDENRRPQVTQFVNILHRLSQEVGVTILLLGHPSKAVGSEYSGSTAWDACLRSRLFFGYPKKKGKNGEDEEDCSNADVRLLRRSKSNYSRVGEEVQVQWSGGVFTVVGGDITNGADIAAANAGKKKAQDKFLILLDELTKQGRAASDLINSTKYAPRVMAGMQDNGGFHVKDFEEAMEVLFRAGRILANGNPFPSRKKVFGIVRASDEI